MKYESSVTSHSKAMANVKVFADKQTKTRTNRQMDKKTGQKLYYRYLLIWGGLKNVHFQNFHPEKI